MKVPTWTPEGGIPDGKYDYNKPADGPFSGGKSLTIVVSVNVVIFVLIGLCWYKVLQKELKEKEAEC